MKQWHGGHCGSSMEDTVGVPWRTLWEFHEGQCGGSMCTHMIT